MFRVYKAIFVILLTVFNPVFAFGYDDLLPDERDTVDIFQTYSPKVVYVHRISTVKNKNSSELMHVQSGAGSGFVWDKDGHIVTNYHVVHDAGEITVTIGNVTAVAKVVGLEPRKDIAVLKVTAPKALALLKDYVPFVLVPTKTLLVGQTSLAIGNPFGLDHTLTIGIISALGREVPGAGGVMIRDMIQTDAPINPGNSGGPLLDTKGRLIGMNTAIFSKSGSSAGIGFAIAADDIGRIVPQLIQHGRVILPGIGIRFVEPNIAEKLGVKEGLLIAAIIPKSPAAKAGLQPTLKNAWGHVTVGDIIVALNGHITLDYDNFYALISKMHVGDGVTITVLRAGKKIDVKMKTIDIASY